MCNDSPEVGATEEKGLPPLLPSPEDSEEKKKSTAEDEVDGGVSTIVFV